MEHFGAKIDVKVSASKDIQYCVVLCHKNISEIELGSIAAFIRQNSPQLVMQAPDQKMWVVALQAQDGDRLRHFPGIKLVGGINMNFAKMVNLLKPVVIDKTNEGGGG